MASKQILGDDPFGTTPEAPPPPPAPPPKKEEPAPIEVKQETYTPVEEAAPSEYGPSIDRPPPARHSGIVDEVKQLERSVRERLLPAKTEQGARNKLPLEFVWKRWRELAMRDRSDVVDEFGRDPQVAERMEPLLQFMYETYFRVTARGLGHIPDEGRALIVANHSGTLPYDGAMIMHAIKHEHPAHRALRPLVEDFVFHFPYLGTLMNRIGGVRACQENAERLLEEDQLVAVFPEGIKGIGKLYRERYQLQRFGRGGFIKLALKCDAPIIPTAVVGAEEIHPMLTKITWLAKSVGIPYIPVTPTFPALGPFGLLPLPTKWYLAFGEPLYYNAEYGAEGANDRILVNKLAEQVRNKIQSMIDELLKQRRSLFFG
jgi:1-acyl-sn-glycerol-3-phosphate acyltransferase